MSAQAPDFKPDDLLPGTKYRVVRQIGAGGMGVVYQVVKPPEIQGVLKLMSTELVEHQEFRVRFLDEVRVLAQLDHPNIVKVFDYDTLADGTPYYVMEVLHGRTVRDVLATMGRIPAKVAFEITRQLCEALHAAHTHHITVVHRDIKPENIFLHAPKHGEPVVKLIDFGVVALADRKHDGTFVGTWKYAAPEQIRGEQAVPATDLYAVALVLYEMLCGVGPFEQYDTGPLISRAHMFEAPPPVSKFAPWVPASIVSLIETTLSKDARHRPHDAYTFAERLYELEWANDGQGPPDRTAEGPLRRILSNVAPAKPAAGMAPARNQDVPIVLVGPRHEGPTLRGVGNGTGVPHEPTSPGEDALLAGLWAPPNKPLSKRERESGPGSPPVDMTPRYPNVVQRVIPQTIGAGGGLGGDVTLDAPASDPKQSIANVTDDSFGVGTTRKLQTPVRAAKASEHADTDTFASQESDTRRPVRGRAGRAIVVIALLGLATITAATVLVMRERRAPAPPTTTAASQPVTETRAVSPPPPAITSEPPAPNASVVTSATTPPVAGVAPRGRGSKNTKTVEPPPVIAAPVREVDPTPTAVSSPQTPAPKPTAGPKQDDSLLRTF